jgi:hypothetical protein
VIDQHLDGIKQCQLSTRGENSLVDSVVRSEVAGVPLNDGFTHIRNAGHNGVAREIGLNGHDGGVFDVTGRGEMRLTGPEIHQIDALGAQFRCLSSDSHGCGNFDTADAFGKDL